MELTHVGKDSDCNVDMLELYKYDSEQIHLDSILVNFPDDITKEVKNIWLPKYPKDTTNETFNGTPINKLRWYPMQYIPPNCARAFICQTTDKAHVYLEQLAIKCNTNTNYRPILYRRTSILDTHFVANHYASKEMPSVAKRIIPEGTKLSLLYHQNHSRPKILLTAEDIKNNTNSYQWWESIMSEEKLFPYHTSETIEQFDEMLRNCTYEITQILKKDYFPYLPSGVNEIPIIRNIKVTDEESLSVTSECFKPLFKFIANSTNSKRKKLAAKS